MADIHKPLLSVSRAADAWYECRLGRFGGALIDLRTGEEIPVMRKHNLHVFKAWARADKKGTDDKERGK